MGSGFSDPAIWSDFGLPGLIIAAGFWVLIKKDKAHEETIKAINVEHRQIITTLMAEHRAERIEWIIAAKEHSIAFSACKRETNEILRELTAVMDVANHRWRPDDHNGD